MAYQLGTQERVADGFVRCTREQLDRAVEELTEGIQRDPVKAVHAARKSIKKQRALLRLLKGALPDRRRARENAVLRAAARELSSARDAEVMLQTLDALAERFAGQLPASTFDAIRAELTAPAHADRAHEPDRSGDAQARDALGVLRMRVESWRLESDGWSALAPGLSRTYRRGRKALRKATQEPSPENLHAWRKRAKDLWYTLRLLEPACGPAIRGQAKDAHRLADLLGDDHDLAVLREHLGHISGGVVADVDAVLALIDCRHDELVSEARQIGRRVYAEKPNAFRKRVQRCWVAGRAAAKLPAEHDPAKLARIGRSTGAAA